MNCLLHLFDSFQRTHLNKITYQFSKFSELFFRINLIAQRSQIKIEIGAKIKMKLELSQKRVRNGRSDLSCAHLH